MKLNYLRDVGEAKAIVERLMAEPILGMDVETCPLEKYVKPLSKKDKPGVDPYRAEIRLVSFAAHDGRVAVFDMRHIQFDTLRPLTAVPWCVFNGSFEYRFFHKAGIECPKLHDVQLLDRLVSFRRPNEQKLAVVAKDVLGMTLDKGEQISDWNATELSDNQLRYAAMDALATIRAANVLRDKVIESGQERIYTLWTDVLPILSRATLDGLVFDWKGHGAIMEVWEAERAGYLKRLQETGSNPELNPRSPKDMNEWFDLNLSENEKESWPKTKRGDYQRGKKVVPIHGEHIEALSPLSKYLSLSLRLSNFGAGYLKVKNPVTGMLHPSFNIGGTVTGRLSSDKPNAQNAPSESGFRSLFLPDPGHVFVAADYDQIELRVAAMLSPG